ncbi:MAG: ferrous iron transport protein B [Thermodesulfobacteriota bacterium]
MPQKHLNVALTGNPNSGKTTLFNSLTGSRQNVGNYPGITVEKKEGFLEHQGYMLHFVDLPGTYSLTAYSQEELVARNFLVLENPHTVVDVLNAGALERNLYLALQILEMGAPLILALNMMDEVRRKGWSIDTELLSQKLGTPVVEMVARQGQGSRELLQEIIQQAENRPNSWQPLHISYGPDLDPVLQEMVSLIQENGFLTSLYPARWTALKYLEEDQEVQEAGDQENSHVSQELKQAAERVTQHCQKTLGTYPEAIIADYRYGFISSLLKDVVHKKDQVDRVAFSDQLDQFLTHKLLGPLCMFFVLYLVYTLTFSLGEIPLGWVEGAFDWLGGQLRTLLPAGLLRSLLVSGIIDGVGSVLSFVPLLAIIFFCIAFLEDSGYMARIAYMLDRVFRIFGLHGCSVMPFIVSGGIAGGCAVPGIMAARTLRSPKEKLATLLTAPFMTCGAKVPVFLLLVGVFFPRHQALVMFLITLTAWASALLVSRLLRSTLIRGPATPFVMELPPYRLPTLQGMLIHTWERTWQYIKKAGTVILALSILIWLAMTFPSLPQEKEQEFQARQTSIEQELQQARSEEGSPPDKSPTELRQELQTLQQEKAQLALRHSLAGRIGTLLEPATIWAGFDWKINISLTGGFAAKEVIISTLGTAYSLGEVQDDDASSLAQRISQDPDWDRKRSVSLIVFILLYAPCFVTVVAIARESGSWGWAFFAMGFNTLLAFILAVGIYQGLSLFA